MIVDLTDELEQSDSGMESLTASKDDTPERKPDDNFLSPAPLGPASCLKDLSVKEFDDVTLIKEVSKDEEPDETLTERLWGLTEMFPEWVRKGTHCVTSKTWSGVKSMYSLSRSITWIVASSSVILFAPVIFEVERAQVEEMQKSQQKQVLLGTNASMSNMPPMPR